MHLGMRSCPKHPERKGGGPKLWAKPQVRPIRFHDLRHSTGSLLMMAGANLAAVSKILRHSDPRITMAFYAHLAPGYLRDEVDRLHFDAPVTEQHAEQQQAAVANEPRPLAASLLQVPQQETEKPNISWREDSRLREDEMVGVIGFEPTTSWSRTKRSTRLSYTPMGWA